MKSKVACNNTCVAFGLIGTGLLFFFSQLFGFSMWSVIWPMFIIGPGLAFLYFSTNASNKELAWLAVPGSILTGTGAIFLVQAITGYWQSWAYVWTLYGAFLGLAFLYAADRTGQREIYQLGRAFIFISLAAFFLLGSIFEFLIFDGFIRRFLLAAVLICAGIWMISQDRDNTKSKPKAKRIPDDEALNELTYFVNSQTIPNDGEINPDHPRSTNADIPVILDSES